MTAELPTLLGRLDDAAGAALRLGLDLSGASTVRDRIAERAALPVDLYTLALVGGTGVGKSSLLNALAGTTVSAAGVRRPTTSAPVAWMPQDRVAEAQPLLAWLGGVDVRTAPTGTGGGRLVLDLPDLDSIEPSHAARVDALLPRVDAVLWVTDPEKYQDAVFHDAYLRRWLVRLGRQAIVLNKIDRIGTADREALRADLARQLAHEGVTAVPVLLASATSDLHELDAWLTEGEDAKRLVTQRLVASGTAELAALAAAAGVDGASQPAPLISSDRRDAAVEAAAREIVAVLDLRGVERQAVAGTRLAARPRGGGPLGIARTVVERGSGLSERRGDPESYLRRWRERGSMNGAAAVLRDLILSTVRDVPPAARPSLARIGATAELAERLSAATDRAVGGATTLERAPISRVWPLFGLAQTIATAAVLLGAAWLVALWLSGGTPAPGALEVPILGPVSIPVVLLAGGVLAWFVLGRLLGSHAGWLGRRWAGHLTSRVRAEVRDVAAGALAPLAEFEGARSDLWRATHDG